VQIRDNYVQVKGMVMGCVFFAVRTDYLNIIKTSFGYRRIMHNLVAVHVFTESSANADLFCVELVVINTNLHKAEIEICLFSQKWLTARILGCNFKYRSH
jgi:hypothetical protein